MTTKSAEENTLVVPEPEVEEEETLSPGGSGVHVNPGSLSPVHRSPPPLLAAKIRSRSHIKSRIRSHRSKSPMTQPPIPLSKPLLEPGTLSFFYLRYYSDIKGEYEDTEFLEFVFDDQNFQYTNLSGYHRDMKPIRRTIIVSKLILKYLQQIIVKSNVLTASDETWPYPTKTSGTEELEINYQGIHISFATAKIGSISDLDGHKDEKNLKNFFYLIRDLKKLGFAMVKTHFRIQEYV